MTIHGKMELLGQRALSNGWMSNFWNTIKLLELLNTFETNGRPRLAFAVVDSVPQMCIAWRVSWGNLKFATIQQRHQICKIANQETCDIPRTSFITAEKHGGWQARGSTEPNPQNDGQNVPTFVFVETGIKLQGFRRFKPRKAFLGKHCSEFVLLSLPQHMKCLIQTSSLPDPRTFAFFFSGAQENLAAKQATTPVAWGNLEVLRILMPCTISLVNAQVCWSLLAVYFFWWSHGWFPVCLKECTCLYFCRHHVLLCIQQNMVLTSRGISNISTHQS